MTTKNTIAIITAALALSMLAIPAFAQNGSGGGNGSNACAQILIDELELLPVGEFDEAEEANILFLREEEKLARDVYLSLSLTYELPIFSRIARSEQQHMNLVGLLLARHGLEDPAADDRIGVFTNPDLEALFFDLVEVGEVSLADAFTVGAIIEDMDILDLETMLDTSDELDMVLVAYNLDAGSHNHLRAFTKALANLGLSYEPRYISTERFEEILSSDPVHGVIFDEFGDVLAECSNQRENGGSGGGNGDCDGTGSGNGSGGNGDENGGGNGGGN